jgi:hypothetical protein
LEEMHKAGVTLDPDSADDFYTLTTSDPAVAKRFGMQKVEEGA